MKLITVHLPDDHNIFFFGDAHHDSPMSSDDGWDILGNMMHSEYDGCRNNYGAEGGDDIEAINPDDKRYSEELRNTPLPLLQMRNAVAKREPIKDLLLYKLQGNHEQHHWAFGDIMADMCETLEVPYGTWTTKMSVTDKRGNLMYKTYDTHGRKQVTSTADDPKRRKVNMQLTLKRHLKFKAGDCAVMIKHHTHKLLVCKPESELYLTDDGERINQHYTGWGQTESYIHPDSRWYGNAGAFLKLYGDGISGYAERAEYDPVELGFLILKVRDRKIVSLDPIYLQI
uniref:Calcineurin-like phosphoesterase domain-containing protein n=1 Tax=viral metagenome TaxID=1070528 RepID=A0A6M3JIU4_9ZZZZ